MLGIKYIHKGFLFMSVLIVNHVFTFSLSYINLAVCRPVTMLLFRRIYLGSDEFTVLPIYLCLLVNLVRFCTFVTVISRNNIFIFVSYVYSFWVPFFFFLNVPLKSQASSAQC